MSNPKFTNAQLLAELQTDPEHVGYDLSGNDAAVAEAINALTGPGAAQIGVGAIDMNMFLTGIQSVVQGVIGLALSTPNDPRVAKYQAWRDWVLQTATYIDPGIPSVQAVLAGMLADGLITQPQIDAFALRTGSRAESLWGAGTVVTHTDVAAALGRGSN